MRAITRRRKALVAELPGYFGNVASVCARARPPALHRALGFTEEGRLRDHEFVAGRYYDEVRSGMTVEEFFKARSFPQP